MKFSLKIADTCKLLFDNSFFVLEKKSDFQPKTSQLTAMTVRNIFYFIQNMLLKDSIDLTS